MFQLKIVSELLGYNSLSFRMFHGISEGASCYYFLSDVIQLSAALS